VEAIDCDASQGTGYGNAGSPRCAGAVLVADEAELVDAGYECSYEAEVDEGYEPGVLLRSVIAEERADGPYCSQYGGYEEDKDVVGR